VHPPPPELTCRKIAAFWLPLFSTWLMMGVEGPFIAAVIARLADPTVNLAAYGVAFSLGMFFESPIIMMLSAANVLVRGRRSYLKLRRFNLLLNLLITAAMGVVLVPAVFAALTEGLIGMPPEVAELTHRATLILLPWPAAIGFRRFYQGILIGNHLPRRVAYGTLVRLGSMATAALLLDRFSSLPGACVGTAALSTGVVMEALASRFMAAALVRRLLAGGPPGTAEEKIPSRRELAAFYIPLAMTSLLGLAVHPLMSFFLGKGRLPIESLAVLPVVNSLTFLFRSAGLSFQEAAIALLKRGGDATRSLRRFAWLLAAATSGLLLGIAFSPAVDWWFRGVSGLEPALARLAVVPIRIFSLIPAFEVLLAFQRARLVVAGRTRPITLATAVELGVIASVLWLTVSLSGLVGVTAAAVAAMSGRACAVSYLQRNLDRQRPGREQAAA
jgi:Na+-driven multidrug efflux pump